jgi:type 1 fimbriae regulatory protein FimB/type 1 fimbriae regulatory protein FimE
MTNLTAVEIEKLITVARKESRWGDRDAAMILISYRHGLRIHELCDLRWDQIDFDAALLHLRGIKNGSPSAHPMQSDEVRALRRRRSQQEREGKQSPHVFLSERGGPINPKSWNKLRHRIGRRAGIDLHPIMLRQGCRLALTHAGHDARNIRGWLGHRNTQKHQTEDSAVCVLKHRGAQSELIASAWLLEQGYEVYRNVSAVGLADLCVYNVATKEWFLVDVKTGITAQSTEEQRTHKVRFLGVEVTETGFTCGWIDSPGKKPEPKQLTSRQQTAMFRGFWKETAQSNTISSC